MPSNPPPPSSITAVTRRLSPPAGVVMAGFFVCSLATCLWAMGTGKIEFMPKSPSLEEVFDGRAIQPFAKSLSNAAAPEYAARLERALTWLTLGDTGDRVRPGCPGWLFLGDELKVHRHADANARAKLEAVQTVQAALAQRGIQLLVGVVPDKSRIVANQLCGIARPASFAGRIADWTGALQAAGIPAIDLTATLQPLGEKAYMRNDSHWSEAGAAAAAQAVAAQVAALGIQATPSRSVTAVLGEPERGPSDLVRLAGLDWLPASLQPEEERFARSRFEVDESADAGELGEDDLFGDSGLPNVALIGTSFSRNGNFAGFLERALGASIGNFSKEGGEFSGAANDYFPGPAFRETPPALVIWEVTERDLQAPWAGEIALQPK